MNVWARPSIAVLMAVALSGCEYSDRQAASQMSGGAPDRGRAIIREKGCGACHTIPGIPGANAKVGPSLEDIAARSYIAGVLQNTPENMQQWLKNPPGVDHKTAMPNLKLTDSEVRDISAYLYTLR